ncbi:hypothetical protein E2C01_049186 [Portunus trituberculatus]|uniref:Uncharacterized protein n=1 Tax=Portunus trituberculatus TaxID=210409 RepID=A0A5B7GFD5_PORTR|nr:hypothetical protein [Portunus trituberculatus]
MDVPVKYSRGPPEEYTHHKLSSTKHIRTHQVNTHLIETHLPSTVHLPPLATPSPVWAASEAYTHSQYRGIDAHTTYPTLCTLPLTTPPSASLNQSHITTFAGRARTGQDWGGLGVRDA